MVALLLLLAPSLACAQGGSISAPAAVMDFWGTTGYAANSDGFSPASANKLNLWSSVLIPVSLKWSHICFNVVIADAAGSYDVGVYNGAGTLLADVGAQSLPSTGTQCLLIVANASCTAPGAPAPCCTGSGTGTCPTSVSTAPGRYRLGTTGTATTATIRASVDYGGWKADAGNRGGVATSNGILPSSVSPPAPGPVITTGGPPVFALY